MKNILMIVALALGIALTCPPAKAETQEPAGGENASDPLAKVRNTDLRWQYFDLDDPNDSRRHDISLDGSLMLHPKLKLKYELHYWETDITGKSENDLESLHVKPIFFPTEGKWGSWKYRTAIGVEWILDFGNDGEGIGSGADQIAPLIGVALIPRPGTTLIPLAQHFVDYNGEDVSQTAFRLIGLQKLPHQFWAKVDAKVPIDWENDNEVPASLELQVGKMLTRSIGVYVDGLFGIGGDKPYDTGFGLAVRVLY